tara:strand:- start:4657 stop:6654 length:1998 start_codon:yes stop_codon:yes gene_type:complete
MSHGYAHSSSSLPAGTTVPTQRIGPQGQIAPAGYHYMPDGTLMTDAEHQLLDTMKIIRHFNFDTTNLPTFSTRRRFVISGDAGASFMLEIKNEDNSYYNFVTKTFQTTKTKLEAVISGSGNYYGTVTFPTVGDDDQYDVYLLASEQTKHADYYEVRFDDGSIDINSSTGSNSLMLQKVIYQYTDITLTIQPFSLNNVTDLIKASTRVDSVTTTTVAGKVSKVSFKASCGVNADTKSYQIINQPTDNDFLSFVEPTISATPIDLPGEDIYPTARTAFTGDDVNGAVTSGAVVRMDNTDLSAVIAVGDKITSPTTSGTVDGAIADGDKIILDQNVATIMAVGDQVFGCAACGSHIVVVKSLDPDGDNAKEFDVELEGGGNAATAWVDGATLTFSSKVNRKTTTVTVVETSGTATDFTMDASMQFRDDQPLTFSARKNFNWPISNFADKIAAGMIVKAALVTENTRVARYEDTVKILEGTDEEQRVVKNRIEAIDKAGFKPTIVKGLVTTQKGNITFDKQQVLALGGNAVRVGGYGEENILRLSGWEIKLTNLAVALTAITTTTTSAVSSSTTVPVASVNGILPSNVSSVSGIGINASVVNPTVSTRSATSGAGNVVLSAAQNLESGITLTFGNAGQVATVTGDIEIIKAGTANTTVYLDMEKLVSIT